MNFLPWNWLKRRASTKECLFLLFFPHLLDDRYGASHEALGPTDIVANSNGKLQQEFVIIERKRMGSYLLKAQLQIECTGVSSFIFLIISNNNNNKSNTYNFHLPVTSYL